MSRSRSLKNSQVWVRSIIYLSPSANYYFRSIHVLNLVLYFSSSAPSMVAID